MSVWFQIQPASTPIRPRVTKWKRKEKWSDSALKKFFKHELAIGVYSPLPLEPPSYVPPFPPPSRLLQRDWGFFKIGLVFVSVSYCRYNKFSQMQWLKATKISYLLILEDRSPRTGFSGLKSRSAGYIPSTGSRGESIPLPFPAS